MIKRAFAAAVLVAAAAGAARAACPDLDEAEVARLVELELGAAAKRVVLACRGGRVALALDGARRTVDLAATPPPARARLVALAAAELSRAPAAPPPRPRPARRAAAPRPGLPLPLVVVPGERAEARLEPAPPRRAPREVPMPSLRAEDVLTPAGEQVRAATERQVRLLQQLLAGLRPDDSERIDLVVRLGDLYVEAERHHRLRARALEARAAKGDAQAAALAAERAREDAQARAARTEAVRRYLEVAQAGAGHARLDEVLFVLGRLLGQAGKAEPARGFLRRLVDERPGSRLVPEALVALADEAFERRDLAAALALYERGAARAAPRLADYARYRIGWCHFDGGRFTEAVRAFVRVADHARDRGEARGPLGRAARRDAVRAWAHLGTPERAWPFVQRFGAEAGEELLPLLARLWGEQGRRSEANQVLAQLRVIAPGSPSQCAWQLEAAQNGLAGSMSSALSELERLAEVAGRSADAGCREAARALVGETARAWHREAQAERATARYEAALRLYRALLGAFPGAADAPRIRFYLGEALYALQRYCEAEPHYAGVADGEADPPLRKEAAYAGLIAARSCVDGAPPGGPAERRLLAAYDRFLALRGGLAVRLRVASEPPASYRALGGCGEAMPLAEALVRAHPDDEAAIFAASAILSCWRRRPDRAALAHALDAACATPGPAQKDAELAARCRALALARGRLEAEADEAAGRYRAAAERYAALAAAHPDDERLDELYHNAAVDYQRAGLVGPSIRALEELGRRRPASPLARRALYVLARSYERIAAFADAAERYERYAARWPAEPDAAQALARAAELRRGLGAGARAAEDTRLFLARYGHRPELADTAAALAFAGAGLYDAPGDEAKLVRHLRAWLRDWRGRGGVDREIAAHVRLGERAWWSACPVAGVHGLCIEQRRGRAAGGCGGGTVTVHPRRADGVRQARAELATALRLYDGGAALSRLPAGDAARAAALREQVARARLLLADVELERALAGGGLRRKSAGLERARRGYEALILTREPRLAVAGAARIGQLYQIFAAQLRGAPLPQSRGPRREFAAAYCGGLLPHVAALEAKAEDALRRCLDGAARAGVADGWSALCEAALNQLDPRRYPLAGEIGTEPGFVTARAPAAR